METLLIELLKADSIPNQIKGTINDIIDRIDGVDEKTMVGELYSHYEREALSKKKFNTLRRYAFELLEERNQKETVAATA